MSLEPDFVIDWPVFERTFMRFAQLSDKSFEDSLLDQGRLYVIDAIKVTPPFHQGVGQGAAVAKKAGEKSIGRNIDRIFVGKTLMGSRKITHLFGRTDVPGLPYVVPTTEKYPDVEGLYAAKKTQAKRNAMRGMRFFGPPLTVSRRKVRKVYQREVRKVGWLAGGWNKAAERLGATPKVPAFVRRHGSAPGQVVVDFSATRLRIVLVNQVKYADYVGGLQKRASFALTKRVHAMQKQIPRLIREASRAL
jgi:hypothetical protein